MGQDPDRFVCPGSGPGSELEYGCLSGFALSAYYNSDTDGTASKPTSIWTRETEERKWERDR